MDELPMTVKRVLIVDDSEIVRDAMTLGLGADGYAVTAVGSYDELGEVSPAEFSLILMDLNMPELYGDDVARVLRHVRGVRVPIFMLSSAPEDELARRVAEAGIDGYISKHAGFDAIVARVRELIGPATQA